MTDVALPTLSVVMACRNAATTLPRMLESVARQRYPGWWELVIVVNGSSDETHEIAQGYADRFPRCTVVLDPEARNQSAAHNTGLAHSTGEAVVFLDSDDEIGADYLQHMGRALTTASLVGAAMDVTRLNPPALQRRRRPMQVDHLEIIGGYLPAVVGATMGARREAMAEIGGWDETLFAQNDLDLSWRLHRAGHEAVFVPEAVLHYRYRVGAAQTFRQEVDYGEGSVALYARHREHGMRRPSVPRMLLGYARLGIALVTVTSYGGTVRLATHAGSLWGRLRGSVRHVTLYL